MFLKLFINPKALAEIFLSIKHNRVLLCLEYINFGYWKHYYLIQAVQTESFWQNSKEEVLGQWESYSFVNQLNCCEKWKVYNKDDNNNNNNNKGKGKVIPLQARCGPEGG